MSLLDKEETTDTKYMEKEEKVSEQEEHEKEEEEKEEDENDSFSKTVGGAKITLKLGDIIQLFAPKNTPIHEQTYFIEYIDETTIILLDIAEMKHIQLNTDKTGNITDESIQNIFILSHSEEDGYARQNGLVPKTWLDIYIGGDVPSIITGEITNLEQDMIEVTTFPELDVIYIDFAYKGIPRDIPIQYFEIRNRPSSLTHVKTLTDIIAEDDSEKPIDLTATSDDYPAEPATIIKLDSATELPDKNAYDVLNSMYLNADGLVLGEELEEIAQVVELPENQRKYGIEIQANDLMDELLSTIPNYQRTKPILDKIHTLIERFKQMREMFSNFDENGNVSGYIQLGALHKPIVERLEKLDIKLSWILPIVKQQRFIYGDNTGNEDNEMPRDILFSNITEELKQQNELFKNYYKNTLPNGVNKYENLYSKLDELYASFVPENDCQDCLTKKQDILSNMDVVIDNLDDFYSTSVTASTKRGNDIDNLSRRRFVIQRYNLGLMKKDKQLMRSGKTVYIRNYMTPSDQITLKSIVTLPEPVVKFSHIDLPATNIMNKVNLHQTYFNLFQLLHKKTDVSSHIVENLDREILYANDDVLKNVSSSATNAAAVLPEFLSNMKEYVLEENLQNNPDKYRKFLNVVIPKTRVLFRLIRKYIKDKLSFVEVVKELEPFMIYSSDISYKQHDEIRYFIKQKIVDLKQEYVKRAQIFKNIRKLNYRVSARMNQIKRVLYDNRELLQAFETAYGLRIDWGETVDVSEVLQRLLFKDNSIMFSDIVATMMVKTLSTPENIMDAFEPAKLDDLTETEKIKARDCTRRYLAKRYNNMIELRKDNENEDVFYDKDLDDTVYTITDKYKAERKAMNPKDFAEFLKLALIHKHQIPSDNADEMVKTLIEGKKRVNEGEYATMKIATSEYSYNKYFRRVKHHWVEDTTIDENMFIDTNTLFCNINEKCFKNETNEQCEPASLTKRRLLEQTKSRMKTEFDIRLVGSIEELERKIKNKLDADYKQLSREQLLSVVKIEKYNNLAYDYGRETIHNEIVVSPHWKLREYILGQDDFQKRQYDIIQFVEMFCREPMIDELNENPNWLYCLDTNTTLFPQSLYKLAAAFIQGGDYPAKLADICRQVGVLSEDGDSIVDKHTGYVLRKIDFITQDDFTDEGMKIISHAIMEEDIQTKLGNIFQPNETSTPAPIFENIQNQNIYNIMRTICNNIGVPLDLVQGFVMSTTGELMEKIVQSPELYEERAKMMEKKKGVRPIPYEIYKDRLLFWIIASCILISIQAAIPSIRTKKTFPGCVRSFSGYPLAGGVEDQSGIEYIACVLFKSKSSTAPWNSIEKLDLKSYIAKIREMLEKIMGERPDVGELYLKKQEFLLLNPNEAVPEEHSVEKWRTFLPPLISYKLSVKIQPMSKEYEREMMDLIRDGHRGQRQHIGLYHSRQVANSYAIIAAMNEIVKKKDVLLRTSSNIPFLENACCHDSETIIPMAYFIKENKEILQYIESVNYVSELLGAVQNLATAPVLYHPSFTGIKYSTIGEVVLVENIYKAFFHYCNFDNDLPIPEPYREICPEKPANGYKREWSLLEKVEFLKINGKQYRPENLEQLMVIVRNQNRIKLHSPATFTQVNALQDLLEGFERHESEVVEGAFRERLLAVLKHYNAQKMVEEPRPELDKFKNHLAKANEKMYYEIVDFMDRYGNMTTVEFDKFQDWLLAVFSEGYEENAPKDVLYKKVQNSKNMVYFMSRMLPQLILNQKIYDRIPTHWELAPIHIRDMERVLQNHWGKLQGFFEDTVIYELLRDIMKRLTDICILVREFPTYSPIIKGDHNFHSLLDNEATNMVYTYFVYSVMYEYIVSSNNPDLLRTDVEETKKRQKKEILESTNDSNQIHAEVLKIDENLGELQLDLQEVNIRIGNQEELKERVARLLCLFVDFEKENHSGLMTYEEIIRKTGMSKKEEKKRITDYLGNLPPEERELEKQFMQYKMGQWNAGQQKGLFEYDKSTYERERNQQDKGVFTVFMQQNLDDNTTGAGGGVGVEELDAERDKDAVEEHDAEGYDIGGYGEEYQDGVFYEEDRDSDDF